MIVVVGLECFSCVGDRAADKTNAAFVEAIAESEFVVNVDFVGRRQLRGTARFHPRFVENAGRNAHVDDSRWFGVGLRENRAKVLAQFDEIGVGKAVVKSADEQSTIDEDEFLNCV